VPLLSLLTEREGEVPKHSLSKLSARKAWASSGQSTRAESCTENSPPPRRFLPLTDVLAHNPRPSFQPFIYLNFETLSFRGHFLPAAISEKQCAAVKELLSGAAKTS
jgi:hypothetical protein